MDPRTNPYTPNAGAAPPLLVGRDDQVERFEILLDRLEAGRTEQSMLITGLRGVGKTVLLGTFEGIARAKGWVTIEAEISQNDDFGIRFSSLARRALLQMAPRERWQDRMKKAAAVLKSFAVTFNPDGSVTAGLDFEPEPGIADSGDLNDDLTDLVVALGEAAQDAGAGVVFLLDEVQYLSESELEAVVMALHRIVQRALPITLVGAGLPSLPGLAGEAKSYAERLFLFPEIGALDEEDAVAALEDPAKVLGVEYETAASQRAVEFTEGYPYFLQEVGKMVWNSSTESPIKEADIVAAIPRVEEKLDGSFFRVRADRTTELELAYLRAMAALGPDPQRASDVAEMLGRTSEQLGPIRSRLISKGLLFTPAYGMAAFTVPQFDRYMIRNHELEVPRVKKRS